MFGGGQAIDMNVTRTNAMERITTAGSRMSTGRSAYEQQQLCGIPTG